MSPRSYRLRSFSCYFLTILGRAMLTARRLAAGLAIAGAGVLAYAVPVSAHSGTGNATDNQCADARQHVTSHHIDTVTGDATVTSDGPVCRQIFLTVYKVPDGWQPGDGFPGSDNDAVPQH